MNTSSSLPSRGSHYINPKIFKNPNTAIVYQLTNALQIEDFTNTIHWTLICSTPFYNTKINSIF